MRPLPPGGVFSPVEASEKWLTEWCAANDCPEWPTVKAGLLGTLKGSEWYSESFSHDGEFITFYGRDAHGEIPDEFWTHVEIVTGRTFEHATSLNCSC